MMDAFDDYLALNVRNIHLHYRLAQKMEYWACVLNRPGCVYHLKQIYTLTFMHLIVHTTSYIVLVVPDHGNTSSIDIGCRVPLVTSTNIQMSIQLPPMRLRLDLEHSTAR